VRDDGKGVSEAIVGFRAGSIGVGIGGMRQRAQEFGGRLSIQNLVPGTLVEVVFPAESLPDNDVHADVNGLERVPAYNMQEARRCYSGPAQKTPSQQMSRETVLQEKGIFFARRGIRLR